MCLISVIIPVYNSAPYLKRCLGSLQGQTFQDFEAILVDDGSVDQSLMICKDFSERDTRFVVVEFEHGGSSCARNVGLSKAKGQYVAFVDSDDYVADTYLSDMLQPMTDFGTDLVFQGLVKRFSNSDVLPMKPYECDCPCEFSLSQLVEKIDIAQWGYTVSKLFNMSLIRSRNLVFNSQIQISEDLDFLLNYLMSCSSVVMTPARSYIYNIHSGSLTNSIQSFESDFESLKVLDNSWQNFFELVPSLSVRKMWGRSVSFLLHRSLLSACFTQDYVNAFQTLRYDSRWVLFYFEYGNQETPYLRLLQFLFGQGWFRVLRLFIRLGYKI